MPTIPIVFPGPVPLRTSGEYTVRPAQSIGAASSDLRASGMANTQRSCARIVVEYPPCDMTPSATAHQKDFKVDHEDLSKLTVRGVVRATKGIMFSSPRSSPQTFQSNSLDNFGAVLLVVALTPLTL